MRLLHKAPLWASRIRLPWFGETAIVWWWEPRDLWVLFYWDVRTIDKESVPGRTVVLRKQIDIFACVVPAFPVQFRFWKLAK